MKHFNLNIKLFGFLCLVVFALYARNLPAYFEIDAEQYSGEEEMAAIYGQACERIRPGEPKSSARVRVTDKAAFVAVSDILDLVDFKKKLSDHDFNVMVYGIVDNLIEDMAVRTIKQEDNNICVELTGFISRENMFRAVESALTSAEINELSKESETEEKAEEPKLLVEGFDEEKILVYIPPTEFYNNTKSSKHAEILKGIFSKKDNVAVIDNQDAAKYVIKSKVLRAKIEQINSDTNRLQMVVSVELLNPITKLTVTEHQNKFVLFSSQEDEQKVAFDLMNKLVEKAVEPILDKIDTIEAKGDSGSSFPSVITPTKSGY